MANAKRLDCPVEYARAETIRELDGWLNRGKRFYPIDTALSAQFWLQQSTRPDDSPFRLKSFNLTMRNVAAWLASPIPDLPESLGEDLLYWLKETDK